MTAADTFFLVAGELFAPRHVAWVSAALLVDACIGDPEWRWHPIRLLGSWLATLERWLFALGLNGYVGGVLLLLLLTATVAGGVAGLFVVAGWIHEWALHVVVVAVLWACLALRDLIRHGERVRRAIVKGDLPAARIAIGYLVGRDTEPMDGKACGRAAVESLAENTVDGVLSPLLYACAFGPLGAVFFKIVSTMDSMVGYKTDRYLRFGWCGARTDDLLNYPVARLSYILFALMALVVPGCSAGKALRIGWRDHHWVPGPNSGWPEATVAGALQRRLIGPIHKAGLKVCDLWIGEESDPIGADSRDLFRTYGLTIGLTLVGLAACAATSYSLYSNN